MHWLELPVLFEVPDGVGNLAVNGLCGPTIDP